MKIVFLGAASQEICDTVECAGKRLKAEATGVELCLGMSARERKKLTKEDLVITFDLSGFEEQTLTGGISYNLLNCKQIHILLKENLANEERLAEPLSLAMFFFCRGKDYCQRIKDKYPDIPYLEEMEGWREESCEAVCRENAGILAEIIGRVIKMCGLREP